MALTAVAVGAGERVVTGFRFLGHRGSSSSVVHASSSHQPRTRSPRFVKNRHWVSVIALQPSGTGGHRRWRRNFGASSGTARMTSIAVATEGSHTMLQEANPPPLPPTPPPPPPPPGQTISGSSSASTELPVIGTTSSSSSCESPRLFLRPSQERVGVGVDSSDLSPAQVISLLPPPPSDPPPWPIASTSMLATASARLPSALEPNASSLSALPMPLPTLKQADMAVAACNHPALLVTQSPPPLHSAKALRPSSATTVSPAVATASVMSPSGATPLSSSTLALPPPPPPPPFNGENGMMSFSQPLSLISSTRASPAPPPPPPPSPPPPPQVPPVVDANSAATTVSTSDAASEPSQLLQRLKAEGYRVGLERHWDSVEKLHLEERWGIEHVVQIFEGCSQLQTIDPDRPRVNHAGAIPSMDESLPLSTRLVQLFSNHVCERIPVLSQEDITTFVVALTSQALPMDEFWLFMMAKRIQDTSVDYSPKQIVIIAGRYAHKNLEDHEFFGALSDRVLGGLQEFSLKQLALFLHSCGMMRYYPQDLCTAVFPLFEDRQSVDALSAEVVGTIISAAALLDQQSFDTSFCCRRLLESRMFLRAALEDRHLAMGLTLGCAVLGHPSMTKTLMPAILEELAFLYPSHKRLRTRFAFREFGKVYRRLSLLGLCAAFSLPRESAWPTRRLKRLLDVIKAQEERYGAGDIRVDSYEPASSSFHLEVASMLRLIDVDHELEHKHHPFCLDILITNESVASE
eukprot:TRINITY_DN25482_c0_g1_i1.p1 TRINITY_DN25482_c0_g1~~TRINITY_DN25482_c0_g1_i1.p1  ORF type:complete len:748 (+),score=112.23 TRINITY_DN25482_c0_g1_i1:82-2325(+)